MNGMQILGASLFPGVLNAGLESAIAPIETDAPLPYRDPALLSRLVDGKGVDCAWVITHQAPELQDSTADFIRAEDRFAGALRVFLASEKFEIVSPRLSTELSMELYSREGEVENVVFNTPEIHMAGGWWYDCFQVTLNELLNQFFQSDRDSLAIVVHGSLVYSGNPVNPDNLTTLKDFCLKNDPIAVLTRNFMRTGHGFESRVLSASGDQGIFDFKFEQMLRNGAKRVLFHFVD